MGTLLKRCRGSQKDFTEQVVFKVGSAGLYEEWRRDWVPKQMFVMEVRTHTQKLTHSWCLPMVYYVSDMCQTLSLMEQSRPRWQVGLILLC